MSKWINEMDFLTSLVKKSVYSTKTIGEALDESESIEVVRCKDCEYWSGEVHDGFYCFQWCSLTGNDMMYDDFCSNAVQKDGDTE